MDSRRLTGVCADDGCAGGRYRLEQVLGRGGMAVVYRAIDTTSGRAVALKQLAVQENPRAKEMALLFEREFHTLAQLSHPRVIEVYDYGTDPSGPYYTMELLDGKDLREQSPLPWREACSALYDVCSSLALLHSRRLLHRDISPRNVRCTQGGTAKLLDFGALASMGAGGRAVGTPAFVAPEVVYKLETDARTDLFSVGATLYYALTGRVPFPARDFVQLAHAWRHKPQPPSQLVPDVPAALDRLVMSLLALEPAMRPRTAFEVMERLAAIAGLESAEPESVAAAYLSTPLLVGRDVQLERLRVAIAAALKGRGGCVLIRGAAGTGRSRMLDACVLEAKTLGAVVLRAGAHAENGVLPAGGALAAQLRDALEQAVPTWQPDADVALEAQLAILARDQPLVIAVDDVHRLDARSLALLVGLALKTRRARLLLALAEDETAKAAGSAAALRLLREHCTPLALSALSPDESCALLRSVFGDVPNLELLAARIHEVAGGNPRETLDLAQHLVDKRLIQYAAGQWALPSQLSAADLPSSAEQVFRDRLARASPLARFLAETQALATHDHFTRRDYEVVAAPYEAQRVDEALSELLAQQILLGDGTRGYALSHAKRAALAFARELPPDELCARHAALAALYEQGGDEQALAAIHHLFAAGQRERALERLAPLRSRVDAEGGIVSLPELGRAHLLAIFERAVPALEDAGDRPRELHDCLRWLVGLSVISNDDGVHPRWAPRFLAQLERDSGLARYRELTDLTAPADRLRRALEETAARYAATPEAERVYRPDEAIKYLVQYVAISIAIGARTLDERLITSLPPLLEPFAPLSPLVEAMWHNAICTVEANCSAQPERARRRAADLYARLAQFSEAELRYVSVIRHALAFCAGALEAHMGLTSAMRWAEILDEDPLQRVNAMHIRKIARLQQGDAAGAEHFRRQAELLAAQASTRQMFTTAAGGELFAYALAHDLTGVKQTCDVLEGLAARFPGWLPTRLLAEAVFQRLRGDLDAALAACDRCLALCSPDPARPERSINTWPRAVATQVGVLVELGRVAEAKERGERALAQGQALGLGITLHDVARALALAEAKLGDHARAAERLEQVIAAQRELGVTGLLLGATYEARARVAIWAGDCRAVEEFGRLTAQEYRHGRGSPLGALYDRLMDEARRAGMVVLPHLSEFESMMTTVHSVPPAHSAVAAAMSAAADDAARAASALRLIGEARGARAGYLYLLGDEGLSLAATLGAAVPDEELRAFAAAQLAAELEPEPATLVASEEAGEGLGLTLAWRDAQGMVFRPVPLRCIADGAEHCVGIALLALDHAQTRYAPSVEIVSAVAAQLVQARAGRPSSVALAMHATTRSKSDELAPTRPR